METMNLLLGPVILTWILDIDSITTLVETNGIAHTFVSYSYDRSRPRWKIEVFFVYCCFSFVTFMKWFVKIQWLAMRFELVTLVWEVWMLSTTLDPSPSDVPLVETTSTLKKVLGRQNSFFHKCLNSLSSFVEVAVQPFKQFHFNL